MVDAAAAEPAAGVKAQKLPQCADPQVSEKSIAVLPFVNMSDDANNEFFSDGISEELLNLLAKIPERHKFLRARAREWAKLIREGAIGAPFRDD